MTKNNNRALSIQVSLNGLSFCIKRKDNDVIEHLSKTIFDKKENPLQIEKYLSEHLNSDLLRDSSFNSVFLVHRNELSTLVPKDLFKEDFVADYLKFNAKILQSDFISSDFIEINAAQNVYVPLVNINNVILDRFGEFIYKHSSTILIENLLKIKNINKGATIYINVEIGTFDMVIIENAELKYINSFEYTTEEDLSYYVLFTMEQLQLDREKMPIRFIGGVDRNDSIFEICYKYIRDVDCIDVEFKTVSKDIPQRQLNNNYVLLNSFN